jgi:hypothetical protein
MRGFVDGRGRALLQRKQGAMPRITLARELRIFPIFFRCPKIEPDEPN